MEQFETAVTFLWLSADYAMLKKNCNSKKIIAIQMYVTAKYMCLSIF